VVASRSDRHGDDGDDIEEDLMTDKHEHTDHTEHHGRTERDGEYTDTEGENVAVPEPESGEYTDSDIPGENTTGR
jgi:hypothetical protein